MTKRFQGPPVRAGDNGGQRGALQQIAQRVSATVGADFFQSIAKHLAKAVAADCVMIGEFVGGHAERLRSVAAVTDGKSDRFDYTLAGTAAAQAATGKPFLCQSGAREQFPDDAVLDKLRAEAFAGVPLFNGHGVPVGTLLAVFRHPVSDLDLPKALLKVFAPRASAELVRKQEEEQLRESEQRYRVFVGRNPIAMWRIDFEHPISTELPEMEQFEKIYQYGYLAECNESLASLMEVEKPESLLGCRVDKLVPPSEPDAREATFRLIRSGYKFTTSEVDLVNRSGKQRHHVRTEWGIVEDDMLVRVWGTTQDLTELRESQIALEASQRRIAQMLEVVQLAVIILDLEGTIKYANSYLKKLTGWGGPDLNGRNWLEALIPVEEHGKIGALTAAISESGSQTHFESTLLAREGRPWWIAWDATALRDAQGNVEVIVLVGRDITEQRAIEEQYRQAQKLEGIGRLAGGIAHDFNNLLTVIVGYCALLLQKGDLPDTVQTSLDEVQKAAEKGAQLTHQLLAFSRRQVLRPQVLRLNALVEDAETMLRRLIGDDVQLVAQLDPVAGCVRADPGHLNQVLMNLVVNARDAMPQGGSVTIGTENVTVASAHDASYPGVPPGDYVVLNVADTGTGMTEDVLSHLFEPFFTTKKQGKGTGMGLPMVYGIVCQTGGHIKVDSQPGNGTRFRIFLPRAEPVSSPPAEGEGTTEVQGGSETILVVEDHHEVRAVAARTLRGLGYTVLEAESPAHAIEMVEGRSDIQMLLSDMMMPGMSGSSLALLLLESRPQLKVLLMSGHTEVPEVAERLGESGMALLRKPFTPAMLAARVREVLDS